jgi:uncharacterized protein (TIRG00374 family)
MRKLVPAMLVSIILAVAGYLLAVVFSGGEGAVGFDAVSLKTWAVILTLSLINYIARFWRWQWYMKELSGVSVPLLRHLVMYFSGFALTTTPGKAGEAIRSFYLKPHGISITHSVIGLFVERLIDLVAIVLLAAYALASLNNASLRYMALLVVISVLIALPLLHVRSLWLWVERKSVALPRALKGVVIKICRMVESSATILRNRHLYLGLLIGLFSWFCEGLGFYILLQSLDVNLSLSMAVGVYSAGMLAGAVSFMPGGLGGAEAAMGLLLLALGVDKSAAVVSTLVCRLATLWFAVLLGLLSCLWLTYKKIYPQWNPGVSETRAETRAES